MVYPESVPYLTLFNKKVTLPLGKPAGYGNMIYLFSSSIDESIRMINNTNTLNHTSAYHYYFYNMMYSGKIQSRRFYINDRKRRNEIYDRISDETNLSPLRYAQLQNANRRNCFFDLSRYLEIYNRLSTNLPASIKMKIFWSYLGGILNDVATQEYQNKIIVIDAEKLDSAFVGQLKERINNPLFLLYYTMTKDISLLKNISCDVFIYYRTKCIRINPSTLTDKDNVKYKQLLIRLLNHRSAEITKALDNAEISKEDQVDEISSSISEEYNFIGASNQGDVIEDLDSEITNKNSPESKINSTIHKKVSAAVKDTGLTPQDVIDNVKSDVATTLDNDDRLLQDIQANIIPRVDSVSKASTARDRKIREDLNSIQVGNTTIGELKQKKVTHIPIPTKDISSSIRTTNKNMNKVTFTNFERGYLEKILPHDMANVFTSLNDKSIPMNVIKYSVDDTSDELNYKDTYTVVLEDTYRQRHTIKVDIPKFIDDRFMWIGGSKKIILCQNFLLPVVKSGPDKVQIVTNVNKMFIERVGAKSTSSMERINKLIATSKTAGDYFVPGYAYSLNQDYITTVEYDEFSKKFIRFKSDTAEIFFSQVEATEKAEDRGITIGENEIFVGFRKVRDRNLTKTEPIMINQDTQVTDSGMNIIDILIEALPREVSSEFERVKIPKKLMYSEAVTMEQPIALSMLLGFWRGLAYLMSALGLEYRLEKTVPSSLGANETTLAFKDCVLVYKEDVGKSLIMNGFRKIETKDWNIGDFETKEPYLNYFIKVYGKANIANPLMANYEFNIDPITKEILEDMKLPTDMVDLCIYANSLLADSQYTPDYNQELSRVRTSEIIPAILYDAIAKQYVQYKNSAGKKKLSLPRDIVIKNILALKTVEDYSTLNPILEMERKHTVLYKGWRGINSDHTYTQDKRVYDDSAIGIIGLTTSPDGSVGVQKVLTMEPNISSLRGHTVVSRDKTSLRDVNLFSPAEMMCPLAITRDDPTRSGHMVKQSKHMIPVKHSSPVLISNGAEEVARFGLSSAFVINADDDGKVIEYNENLGIMICEYKNGSHRAINLKPFIEKNGGGGFYLSNVLITNLKLGSTFKRNDMLAWHKDFFHSSKYCGNRLNMGTLTKVALMSTFNTYQDSTVITEKLSEEMATEMVFPKQVVIGKNSNLDYLIAEGSPVDVGDSLVQFDTSFEDNELNQLLNSLSTDLKEGILESSRNDVRSKYAGVVERIKIYSTVDLDELSPSLQKVVKKYYKKVGDMKALLSKYDKEGSIVKCGILIDEPDHKIDPNKFGVVKGQSVEDGVLIEIYIKHEEYLETASKVAYFTGLKATIGEVIESGYEPWSEHRPDEEVSSLIASNSVLKRMTPSIVLTSLGNKNIVELKRSLEKIFNEMKSKGLDELKRAMTTLIYKFFSAFDKTGSNTKKYKEMFDHMTPQSFKNWFVGFFADKDAYLILDIVDYERTIDMDDIERAAKVLGIPLYEYVYLPHITMDKNTIIRTRTRVPVGYIHIKRTQQTVAKKNGISTSNDTRSPLTNQVTGIDKNGRESDLENTMLVALGMTNTLKELNGPRADDMVMKREMISQITSQGYVKLADLTNDLSNKTTLNTVNAFFLGMGLKTDLVTKGLMLGSTIKKDL